MKNIILVHLFEVIYTYFKENIKFVGERVRFNLLLVGNATQLDSSRETIGKRGQRANANMISGCC